MVTLRTIALLGGGQLGRMFIENALRYNVSIHVLDPDPQAPCARLADRFVVGDIRDAATVVEFARNADVVGIEIEHVSVEAMDELKRMGIRVIPDPDVLRTIKDKGLQKEFYRLHGIPSAPFVLIDDRREIEQHNALFPAVLKSRSGGYDGKGVWILDGIDHAIGPGDGPYVLEKRVDIAKELAVLVVRSAEGAQVVYDPVEMVFDPRYNLVDHLRAPARITSDLAHGAQGLAKRVAEAFSAPGLYAVELFLTEQGELLVNETAPRAHNSGHHTIEACASSQFDQLLRVYMGWPLGDHTLREPAAMVNLVGEGGTGNADLVGLRDILHLNGTYPHWYGKPETRTGRKMGHVTITAPDQHGLDQGIAVTKIHCKVVPVKGSIINQQ